MHPFTTKTDPLQSLFDAVFQEDHPYPVIRTRGNRQILRVPSLDIDTPALCVKVYHHLEKTDRLKAGLARTGGLHDFCLCDRLYKAELPVPHPVGCAGWPKGHLLPRKTVFAQPWINGAVPLSQLIHRKKEAGQIFDGWLARLFDQLGKSMAAIHQRGFFPRDMHPGNLLVKETNQELPELWLIDYESVRLRRLRRKSIAHLSLGHLCSYLNAFSADVHEQLSLAYVSQWPIFDPSSLSAKVRRVANEHFMARQKRIDRAFEQIARTRKKTRHAP